MCCLPLTPLVCGGGQWGGEPSALPVLNCAGFCGAAISSVTNVNLCCLSSCLLRGCSERSQQPYHVRASTVCWFELTLSTIIVPTCCTLLTQVHCCHWSRYQCCVFISIAQEKYFFLGLTVGALACKLQNDWTFSFFFLIWNRRRCCEQHVNISVYKWIIF